MKNSIKQIFKDNGQRITKSREQLLVIFVNNPNKHFTIIELISILKIENNNHINISTLYNNLATFMELNIIDEFNFNNNKCYELACEIHGHFICVDCDDIINVEVPGLACVKMEISKKYKVKVYANMLEFKGLCEKCQLKDE